jgi:hypothetical protein
MSRSPSLSRLVLQQLEDRATPATGVYNAVTHTLTVTADEADKIVVSSIPNKPTGYLQVTSTQGNPNVFTSATANRVVRNLVFKFGKVNLGEVEFGADAKIAGNLMIAGAKDTQFVDVLGNVAGNVTYTPNTLPAFEDIDIGATAVVGGNVRIGLGGGENTLRIKGGHIRGNLSVLGGSTEGAVDRVELMEDGNLVVDGNVAFNLGSGTNDVVATSAGPLMWVNRNFTYTGTTGNDTFDLDGMGGVLNVKGHARFTLGTSAMFDANLVKLEALRAGKSIAFKGAIGNDRVIVSGAIVAGTNLSLALGNGMNEFESNEGGMATNAVGGNLTYRGGNSGDIVRLDSTTIGKTLAVSLGENGGAGQVFFAGLKTPAGVTVHGHTRVTAGSGADAVLLRRMTVDRSLTILTGAGDDIVSIDNLQTQGASTIDLGGGDDQLLIELLSSDSGGLLSGNTTFTGAVTIKAGDGADLVDLSADSSNQTFIHFASPLVVQGGNQEDTLRMSTDNVFDVGGNFTDTEIVDGPALP